MRDRMWFFTSIRDQRTGVTVDNFPVENPGGFFFETRLTNVTYKMNYQLSPEQPARPLHPVGPEVPAASRRRQHGVLRRAVPPGQLVVGGQLRLEQHHQQQVRPQHAVLDVRLRLAELAVRHQRRGQQRTSGSGGREQPDRQHGRRRGRGSERSAAASVRLDGHATSRTTAMLGQPRPEVRRGQRVGDCRSSPTTGSRMTSACRSTASAGEPDFTTAVPGHHPQHRPILGKRVVAPRRRSSPTSGRSTRG